MGVALKQVSVAAVCATFTLSLVGCTASNSAPHLSLSATGPSSSTTSTHSGTSPGAVVTVTSNFSVLSFRNPASWHAYVYSGENRPPDYSAFLTNDPLNPRCRIDTQTNPSTARCPDNATYIEHLGPGGVEVDVSVIYQKPEDRPDNGVDLDGYRADIDTGSDAMGNCTGSDARSAINVTATPPTNATQPGDVWLFACFGPNAGTARQEFLALAHTIIVRSRPSDSVPAAGAKPCTGKQLTLAPGTGPGGVSQTFAESYSIRNIGTRTCVISGYPNVVESFDPSVQPTIYHDGGGPYAGIGGTHPRPIYLRPDSYGTFLTSGLDCQENTTTKYRRTVPGTTRITLPNTHNPRTITTAGQGSPHGVDITLCKDPTTIYISPIYGY
jgi:hypothetical protein